MRYSVVMPGAVIEPGATVEYAILGEECRMWGEGPGRRAAGSSSRPRQVGDRRGRPVLHKLWKREIGCRRTRMLDRDHQGGAEKMNRMHGIIFAYGRCAKLQTLVEHRVADSIPYAARYRIIDFMLSNMVNAGVTDVGVVLQDKYQSMLDHLGSGKDWDLSRKHGGLRLLPLGAQGRPRPLRSAEKWRRWRRWRAMCSASARNMSCWPTAR